MLKGSEKSCLWEKTSPIEPASPKEGKACSSKGCLVDPGPSAPFRDGGARSHPLAPPFGFFYALKAP